MARRKKDDEPDTRVNPNSQSAREELRQFIEQLEALHADKAAIAEQIKDKFSEIKGRGYDVPALKVILRERKQDRDELAEKQAILDLYREAMGMLSSQETDEEPASDDDADGMI